MNDQTTTKERLSWAIPPIRRKFSFLYVAFLIFTAEVIAIFVVISMSLK